MNNACERGLIYRDTHRSCFLPWLQLTIDGADALASSERFAKHVVAVSSDERLFSQIAALEPEMVIASLELFSQDAASAIRQLRLRCPEACLVMTFRELNVAFLARLRHEGATDLLVRGRVLGFLDRQDPKSPALVRIQFEELRGQRRVRLAMFLSQQQDRPPTSGHCHPQTGAPPRTAP
jgi:hypothetical protein